MTNRPQRPSFAAGIVLALIATWLIAGSGRCLPPTTSGAEDPLAAAAVYRPVRAAVAPRDVSNVGYFQPVGAPRKTQAALERVIEFDVDDVPLDVFFSDLERAAGVRFLLDAGGMEEAAITSDAEIACRSAGMPLGVVLETLLRELDLAYVARDEYVLITSRETGDLMPETRLYALVDHPLLGDAEKARLAQVLRQHAEPNDGWWDFVEVNATPGAIAVGAPRDVQERVAAILAQYARLFAEYDSPELAADSPSNGEASDRDEVYVPVHKTRTPRDERSYFRPMTRRPRTAAILDRPAKFEIDHKPLGEFFAELSEKLRVPFVLDEEGLADARMTPQRLLTFRAGGLTYATELSWMLRPYDLALVPREDEIRVTWLHDLSFAPETRRYAIVDHPLLRGEGTKRLLDALRRHVAVENVVYPEGWGIRVDDGVLSFSADAPMLDQAEDFLRQYRRLLAQYDLADSPSSQGPIRYSVAWSEAAPTSRDSFRCLAERPWPALVLQKTADIAVVDTPLETIFARAEQTLGVPFVLDEVGLEEAALTSDAEVTFHSGPGETYAGALSRMLQERKLAYLPREHYALITSRDAAEYLTETRVYALLHLPDRDAEGLVSAIQKHLEAFPDRRRLTTVHVLPGALVVTGNARILAGVEDYLAGKYGLAPPRYADKPAPPRGPAMTIRPLQPAPYVPPPDGDPFGIPSEADPFASRSFADPFGPPPPDPFASDAGDPE